MESVGEKMANDRNQNHEPIYGVLKQMTKPNDNVLRIQKKNINT